jgi:hypothetical protein
MEEHDSLSPLRPDTTIAQVRAAFHTCRDRIGISPPEFRDRWLQLVHNQISLRSKISVIDLATYLEHSDLIREFQLEMAEETIRHFARYELGRYLFPFLIRPILNDTLTRSLIEMCGDQEGFVLAFRATVMTHIRRREPWHEYSIANAREGIQIDTGLSDYCLATSEFITSLVEVSDWPMRAAHPAASDASGLAISVESRAYQLMLFETVSEVCQHNRELLGDIFSRPDCCHLPSLEPAAYEDPSYIFQFPEELPNEDILTLLHSLRPRHSILDIDSEDEKDEKDEKDDDQHHLLHQQSL